MASIPPSSLLRQAELASKKKNQHDYFAKQAMGVSAALAYVFDLDNIKRVRAWFRAQVKLRRAKKMLKRGNRWPGFVSRTQRRRTDAVGHQSSSWLAGVVLGYPALQFAYEQVRFSRWMASVGRLYAGRVAHFHRVSVQWLFYALHHADSFDYLSGVEQRARFRALVMQVLAQQYTDRFASASVADQYAQEMRDLESLLGMMASPEFSRFADYFRQASPMASWLDAWTQLANPLFVGDPFTAEFFGVNSPVSSADFASHRAPRSAAWRAAQEAYAHAQEDAVRPKATPLTGNGWFSFAEDAQSDRHPPKHLDASHPMDDWAAEEALERPSERARRLKQVKVVQKPMHKVFTEEADALREQAPEQPYCGVERNGKVTFITASDALWAPFLKKQDKPLDSTGGPKLWFHGGKDKTLEEVVVRVRKQIDILQLQEPPNCVHILHNNRHIELTKLHVYRTFLTQQEYSQLTELRTRLQMDNQVRASAVPSCKPAMAR